MNHGGRLWKKGMRMSRPKHKFVDVRFEMKQYGDRSKVKILVVELENVTHFKFLESIMEDTGGLETESKHFLTVLGEIGRSAVGCHLLMPRCMWGGGGGGETLSNNMHVVRQ